MVKKENSKVSKSKSNKLKELAKKISRNDSIDIKPGKGWFEDVMSNLDKKDK